MGEWLASRSTADNDSAGPEPADGPATDATAAASAAAPAGAVPEAGGAVPLPTHGHAHHLLQHKQHTGDGFDATGR